LQIDLEYLRRHYAALSDEALEEIDETELVDQARRIYDEELTQRKLGPRGKALPIDSSDDGDEERSGGGSDDALDGGPEPDWIGDSAVAASFLASPGGESAQDAAEARDAPEAAGIQCYLATAKVEPPRVAARPQEEYRLLVPGKLSLEAESVLDKEIFNREIEAQWKTHFEMLSDEELRALDLDVLLAGLEDRIARMSRAYREELAQRELK